MYNLNSCSGCSCSYSNSSASSSSYIPKNSFSLEYKIDAFDISNSYDSFAFESESSLAKQIKIYDLDNKYNNENKDGKKEDKKYDSENNVFRTALFLNPERPKTRFITNIEDLRPIITETFESLTGTEFPDNMNIKICSHSELKKVHETIGGLWSDTIQGFSLNRNRKENNGLNEIFVKEDEMDSMMITIGHEIGHVMTPTLNNRIDEEAKAFAFSLAWMKTIKENNIGGLASNISVNPAKNGLHDKAFDFVVRLLISGKNSFEIFSDISRGEFSFDNENIVEYEVC